MVLESPGGVIGSAVVGAGYALFVKRFADGAGIYRWDGAALGDSFSVHSAVRQEPGRVVVDHVEGSSFALWIGMVRTVSKVVANWRNAGLRGIAALGEVAVEIDVHSVLVVRARQRIGIGDAGRRRCGSAIASGPEDRVAGAEHHMIGAGAAHEGLMKIVAHGELVGEALEDRSISGLDVVEGTGVPPSILINLVGNRKTEGINFARIRGDDERIQVVQATRGIVARGVLDAAIRLLPHLEEPVRGIAGVGIVGQICSLKR